MTREREPIKPTVIGVSHYRERPDRESLVYAIAAETDTDCIPDPVVIGATRSDLAAAIKEVRDRVGRLTQRAIVGQPRDGLGIEGPAERLARLVLPSGGFRALLEDGHPQLDIIQDAASAIPWEVLSTSYHRCPTHGVHTEFVGTRGAVAGFCPETGDPLELATEKLAIGNHLTHLVRGGGRTASPGTSVLVVADPVGDLCDPEWDPDGVCADHIDTLIAQFEKAGFQVNLMQGRNATRRRVLAALADPTLAAVYYFGHGYLPSGDAESCLVLHDEPLSASAIEECAPTAPFVFLNACHAARSSSGWEIEDRSRSVATAFARGGRGKVVIAPLFPVVNVQAAETALEFFSEVDPQTPLAVALAKAREASLARYESGEAHLAWMAYRYFGSPNARLQMRPAHGSLEASYKSVFEADGTLDTGRFTFPIKRVLYWADKCRNARGRPRIGLWDLFAGFVGAGDLARYVIRRLGMEPDELYARSASGSSEGGADPEGESEGRRSIVASEDIVRVLESAAKLAAEVEKHPEAPVSEFQLLSVFLATDWLRSRPDEVAVPTLSRLFEVLRSSETKEQVDDDGQLRLEWLDPGGQRVMKGVHELAQQRGVMPITHRILFAGLIADPAGTGATQLREHGLRVDKIHELMLAASHNSPLGFGLGYDAAQRILLPVLQRAREGAADVQAVTEPELFRAFCSVAATGFRESLAQPGIDVHLDVIGASSAADSLAVLLNEAAGLARAQGSPAVMSPHLFAAMIGDGTGHTAIALSQNGFGVDGLAEAALSLVKSRPHPVPDEEPLPLSTHVREILDRSQEYARRKGREYVKEKDILKAFFADGAGVVGELLAGLRSESTELPQASGSPKAEGDPLARLGTDLTELARRGILGPVIGRDREIDEALQTLLMIAQANPLLVGEPGVGKTAIVQGIAIRIANGDCPPALREARVVEVSVAGLLAGTTLRGELEERLMRLLGAAGPNVILFVDEIHSIVGAGGSRGPDVGDMLKTWLTGGGKLIGASTPDELRRTILRDRALARRFQIHAIEAPSRRETIAVLRGLIPTFEAHHDLRVEDEAAESAVELSGRYVVDRAWPAKARDLLDRACALAVARRQAEVTREHVEAVLSRSGIRIGSGVVEPQGAELVRLLTVHLVGQDDAIGRVASALFGNVRDLGLSSRPRASLMLSGPPGVGKTELAKLLASYICGDSNALVRFDMGEFSEPHSVARLIGAAPGYVGSDRGSPLVEQLRRRPRCVLLFDEIDHAHPDVARVLFRLLSEGTVVDSDGLTADARDAVVIFTTNLEVAHPRRIGFGNGAGAGDEIAITGMHPAFLDRLDSVISFRALDFGDLVEIAVRRAVEIQKRLTEMTQRKLIVPVEAIEALVEAASATARTARDVLQLVESSIGSALGAASGPEVKVSFDPKTRSLRAEEEKHVD